MPRRYCWAARGVLGEEATQRGMGVGAGLYVEEGVDADSGFAGESGGSRLVPAAAAAAFVEDIGGR